MGYLPLMGVGGVITTVSAAGTPPSTSFSNWDSSQTATSATTSKAMNATGSNRLGVIFMFNDGSRTCDSATWNGNSMTEWNTGDIPQTGYAVSVFYALDSQMGSGSVTVACTFSGTCTATMMFGWFTGVNQTTPIPIAGEQSHTAASGTSDSLSFSPSASQAACIMEMIARAETPGCSDGSALTGTNAGNMGWRGRWANSSTTFNYSWGTNAKNIIAGFLVNGV